MLLSVLFFFCLLLSSRPCAGINFLFLRLFFYMFLFMKQYNYYVYLLTSSENSVFYVGVTNDLIRRVIEHKIHRNDGFTNLYNVTKLVYFETFSNIEDAIKREKQVKRYKRLWKVNLVNGMNAEWNDLSGQIGVTKEMLESAKFSLEQEAESVSESA